MTKPLATGPNQLWSWDITILRGLVKWSFYYLYVILMSSAVMSLAGRSCIARPPASPDNSSKLLRKAADHARSAYNPRRSRICDDLQVAGLAARRSRRRQDPQPPPRSNGNPFSEAHMKSMKYRDLVQYGQAAQRSSRNGRPFSMSPTRPIPSASAMGIVSGECCRSRIISLNRLLEGSL